MAKILSIPTTFLFQEKYVPAGKRKPVEKLSQSTCEIRIPMVSNEEAPVAFRHKAHTWFGDQSHFYNTVLEYRAYNGELYIRKEKSSRCDGWITIDDLREAVQNRYSDSPVKDWDHDKCPDDPQVCAALFQKEYEHVLILTVAGEEQVWHRAAEPMYCIYTFGLGHNHAGIGTSVSIDKRYNENISHKRYFSALQREACIKEALRIAEARGDTDSFDSITQSPEIEVLMPEMVRRNPAQDHGDGDPFHNMLEGLTEKADSVAEAGILAIAATMMK